MSRMDERQAHNLLESHRKAAMQEVIDAFPERQLPSAQVLQYIEHYFQSCQQCVLSSGVQGGSEIANATRKLAIQIFLGPIEDLRRDFLRFIGNSGQTSDEQSGEQVQERRLRDILDMIRQDRIRWKHRLRTALEQEGIAATDTDMEYFITDIIENTLQRMEQEVPVLERYFPDAEEEKKSLHDAADQLRERLNGTFDTFDWELVALYQRSLIPPEHLQG